MSFHLMGEHLRARRPAISIPGERPILALLVAPYTSRGGGMGRMMAYVADQYPAAGLTFEKIESRGDGHAVSSIWPMLKAAGKIWRRSREGHRVVLHVNMAERGSVLRKGVLLFWARWLGLPTVLHLHAAEIVPSYDTLSCLERYGVRRVFQSANVCIVLGQVWRRWLQDHLGVEPGRIEILHNGVPRAGVLPFPVASQHRVLVFLGNMQARKGIGDLLSALAGDSLRDREWTFIAAGGGDRMPFCQRAVALGLAGRVQFQSWLSRDACTALLARAYVLILPSYHEGLPLVLLEAASFGVPAITTAVGAIAEVFTHEVDVLFVPPGDVAALEAAIRRLQGDPMLRARLGQNAKKLYERALTIEQFTSRLEEIYTRHCPDGLQAA